MTVRIIQVLSGLALIGATLLFGVSVRDYCCDDLHLADGNTTSPIERFKQEGGHKDRSGAQVPPLVQQAQILAAYLNPPPAPKPKASPRPAQETMVVLAPEIKPANTSPKFELHGISYRPAKPEASLALIWQPDTGHRWVKEGAQLGHIVIVEISAGEIAYRTEEQTYTMLVAPKYQSPRARAEHDKTLASSKKRGMGRSDRAVAVDTIPSRKTLNRPLTISENTPVRTNRPQMRRYRLGR